MTNPYEPMNSVTTAIPTVPSRRFYAGGILPIAMISVLIGGVVGALIIGFDWQSLIPMLGIPAIGWLCASGLLAYLIRSENFTFHGRVMLALLLPIPAFILYVPVCVVGSMFTTPVLGGKNYGPTTAGATIGSAFAFSLILMLMAVAVRAKFRVRESASPPHIDAQT